MPPCLPHPKYSREMKQTENPILLLYTDSYLTVALKVTVLSPCFPRFKGDYHGVFVKELCDNLSSDVELSVLAPRSRTIGEIDAGYHVERFPYLPRQGMETLPEETMKGAPISRLVELPFYLGGACRALTRTFSSLTHAHLAIPLGLVASISCRPSIITCHGSDLTLPLENLSYLPFTRMALRKATRIVTVSKYLERLARKLGASKKKTQTIHLGVDTNRFKPGKARKELTIGTLGRLVPQKNIEDLLRAMHFLQKRYDIMLRIGGDGPSRGYLETLASKLGLESVEFTGIVKNPVAFHQSLDLFVLCSTREGLSISLQEAMSCGVTPVAVNACGCDELITDGENGYLFQPRNGRDLASKMEAAINTRMGDKARETILEGFDSSVNAKKYLPIYHELGHRF